MPETEDFTAGLYCKESDESEWTKLTSIIESWNLEQEINQVTKYSRDGTFYMQIIGDPRKRYDLICYAKRAEATNIEAAWASGKQIRFISYGLTHVYIGYGRIVEYSKDPVLDQNNLTFDGTSWEEYYKITLSLNYEPHASGSSSSDSSSGWTDLETVSGGPD